MSRHSTHTNTSNVSVHALIVAAGQGSRFGANIPKQYVKIDNLTLLQHSVAKLAGSAYIQSCLLVIAKDDSQAHALDYALPIHFAIGGAERWQSVQAGVQALYEAGASEHELVLIHDAARPAICVSDIDRVIVAAQQEPYGAILATPVTDTLKAQNPSFTSPLTNDNTANYDAAKYIKHTVERDGLWQAQTPQVFRMGQLRKVLAHVTQHQLNITDEASAFEALGLPIRLVNGSRHNIKLTYPEDLSLLRAIMQAAF